MTALAKLNLVWDGVDTENPLLIQAYLGKNASSFIDLIITKTQEKEKFEIGVFKEGWQSGSVISFSENSKTIELRLKKNNTFEILLSIRRGDKEQIVKHKLTAGEINSIPQHLARLMNNIKELEFPAAFYNSPIT